MSAANAREGGESDATAESAVAAAARHLDRGEPLLAYDAARAGLDRWPAHPRLAQLEALALARSGDAGRANARLAALVAAGMDDAETLGMLARTHKDLAQQAPAEAREAHRRAAFALYERALRAALAAGAADGAIYTGINAASMAAVNGDLEGARRLARELRARCEGAGGAADYWREATLGEAALLLGEAGEAAARYAAAARLANGRWGDLGSTRRQARLLAAILPGAMPPIEALLAIPPVVAVTGSMVDAPGRPVPRFPPALEGAVRGAIRERLAALAPAAMYASAACGADLLALEAMRERGGETHVVLPFPPAAFRAASVDFAGGDWGDRFERALAAADSVTVTSDHAAAGSTATFEYANLVLTGLARLRAQVLDTGVRGLAAWDPGARGEAGGAGSLAAMWERQGLAVEHVLLPALRGEGGRARAAEPAPAKAPAKPPVTRHELRALLFADAVGYSQLDEDQIPRYIEGFLGAVAALNARTAHRFEHAETSGDGLYLVFARAADAGAYALELAAMVAALDRAACGLPPTFTLRIALHCGPVHVARDPITGRPMFTGPHTSRAARIEPVTPPGQVYASSAFAAVAAAEGAPGLLLRYVGPTPLAKGYGTLGLYHVLAAA